MKTFIAVTFLLGSMTTMYCQGNFVKDVSDTAESSEVVTSKTGNEVSVYVPDINADINVTNLQKKFIDTKLGSDYEGYDSYFVTMEVKDGVLKAIYDSKGKLIRVDEKYENVKLPNAVVLSLKREFPGWGLADEQFLYSQKEGKVIKKEYCVKIVNEKKTRKIILQPDGEIIGGL